jgi:acyl carrier protein
VVAPLPEVIAIVRDLLRDDDLDISSATRFDDLANWDSMDLVTAVVEAGSRFDLQFDLQGIDHLVTVGDLVHMIAAKQVSLSA